MRFERQPSDTYVYEKNVFIVRLPLRFLHQTIYFAFDPNMDLVLVISTVVCTMCYMPCPT